VLKTTGGYFFALISKGDQELARMVGCTGGQKTTQKKAVSERPVSAACSYHHEAPVILTSVPYEWRF
jgi:hypothetical protein